MLEDTRTRKPGYHSEAIDKWKMARVPLANNKGNTKVSPSTTQTPQLSPAVSIYSTRPLKQITVCITIQGNDRYEQNIEARCPQNGTFIFNLNGGTMTQGPHGNQSDYPEYPLLGFNSGPISTLGPSPDTTSQSDQSNYPEYPLLGSCDGPIMTSPLWDTASQRNQSDYPEYPLLSPHDGPINTFGPSPDTASLTPYQPCTGQAFTVPGYYNEQPHDQAAGYNDKVPVGYVDAELHNHIQKGNDRILAGEVDEECHECVEDCIIVACSP
jgi:hypothetical protein